MTQKESKLVSEGTEEKQEKPVGHCLNRAVPGYKSGLRLDQIVLWLNAARLQVVYFVYVYRDM